MFFIDFLRAIGVNLKNPAAGFYEYWNQIPVLLISQLVITRLKSKF